ncbi:hypothetical protein Esi_0026_0127 [Ectocarpus siliculosus]|uniref:Uncharacterized protein n=1 Tax=Ectocarpus siliculosus TaxID=2880 RepID=D8LJN3_ECTSI|nr:hypothetical protein Esi_0026_0127 [Ectocarpus siliculosus]|eukprot:CBN77060.1 hypothetical protein Esi_0026_0127 [Ectocarpus siliculosus]
MAKAAKVTLCKYQAIQWHVQALLRRVSCQTGKLESTIRPQTPAAVYNRCHGDFSSSLENLKDSFQQCSIDGTGWATVTSISAVMKKAGITTDEAAVLLLANEPGIRNNHNNTGYAHEQRQDNSAAKSAPRAPLVYWPNIIDFVEQGPARGFGYRGNDVQCTEKWRTSTSSTNNIPPVAKHRFDSGAKKSTTPEDLNVSPSGAGQLKDDENPEGIADSVDLRRNDDFGRNALYYACLCGHAHAAHFVVVRAYGDVEGIPQKERRECRMNALSEEIRRYLDTGISSGATPRTQEAKQDEGRPAQAVPPDREKYHHSGAERIKPDGAREHVGSAGSNGRAVDARESSLSLAHNAASSAEGALSVASLFGWGHDRQKDADY